MIGDAQLQCKRTPTEKQEFFLTRRKFNATINEEAQNWRFVQMPKLERRHITRGRPPNPQPQMTIRILPGSESYCYLNVKAVELLMEKFGDRVRVLFDAKRPLIAFAKESGDVRCVRLERKQGGIVFRWGNFCSLLGIREPTRALGPARLDMVWNGRARKATVDLEPLVEWSGDEWLLRSFQNQLHAVPRAEIGK